MPIFLDRLMSRYSVIEFYSGHQHYLKFHFDYKSLKRKYASERNSV